MSYPPPDGTEPPQPPPSVPYPTGPSYQPGSASIPPPQPPQPEYYPPTSQFQPGPPPPPYGPQYTPQPGPPPPPPRRSNLPIVAVIIAVTLLLCGGVATAGVLIARQATEKAKEAVEPITRPTLPEFPALPSNPVDIPDLPTEVPGLPDPNKQIKVTYEVRGDGPVDIIYIEKLGDGPKTIRDAKLPWKFSTTMQGAALVSVTAVRGANDNGKISCRATVDGAEVAESSKTGAYASASCIKAVIG